MRKETLKDALVRVVRPDDGLETVGVNPEQVKEPGAEPGPCVVLAVRAGNLGTHLVNRPRQEPHAAESVVHTAWSVLRQVHGACTSFVGERP